MHTPSEDPSMTNRHLVDKFQSKCVRHEPLSQVRARLMRTISSPVTASVETSMAILPIKIGSEGPSMMMKLFNGNSLGLVDHGIMKVSVNLRCNVCILL